ncbi:MAG TPA: mandelate racemase/muconate lactonizing enzyme family protein [Acidobacteriota bacterium]|jgi:L-alanine-DL-glutamate epimerase-like enolase superfamily enzyme
MNRREFIQAGASLVAGGRLLATEKIPAADELRKFRITQITGFRHVCRRPKLVGKNSHLDVHGWETRDNVLRIATDQGIAGVGVGAATPEKARSLLGHTLDEYWKPGVGMLSPLERADHALFDLVGKALNQPAWRLLGGRGPEQVPVYDGGIYFNDLLPEHQERGVARLLEEVEESLREGHRAFKIKVGRGFKWMDRDAGFRRDIEVVKAIRRLVGKKVKLMVDANNGFDLETTLKFLQELGDELFFIEEMFPEQVEQDLELKRRLKEKGWKTRVADGESARDVNHFDAYIQNGALDVLQPDIRAFGLTRQWELSRKMAGKPHIKLAPHNWGSFLGLHMQVVLARGIPNFLLAEQDRSSSDLFDTSAFTFKEGMMRVPDLPGCGLILREDVFKQKYQQNAWTVTELP